MISAVKAIYICVTCAYCIQFVASYPVSLFVMAISNGEFTNKTAAGRWILIGFFYLVFLAIIGAGLYYLYRKQTTMSHLLF